MSREIFKFEPEAKIVIMLRDPVEFLHSLHAKLRYMGEEDRQSLAEALEPELEERRKRGLDIPKGTRSPSILQYSDAARFSRHIERYRDVFPLPHIRIVLLDDLEKDAEQFVGDVLEFLGVDRTVPPRPAETNRHLELRSRQVLSLQRALGKKMVKLVQTPGFAQRRLTRVLPFKVLRRTVRVIERLNQRRVERRPLDDDLRHRLMARFRPEVERLSALLERDLVSLWGYGAG